MMRIDEGDDLCEITIFMLTIINYAQILSKPLAFGNKTGCGKLPVQLTNRQICQNQMEKQTQEYSERSSGTEFLLSDEKQTRGKRLEHLIYRANKKITSSEILCKVNEQILLHV